MKKVRVRWCLMPFFIFLMIVILFRFVLLIGFVPSESMEPTLKAGSLLLASRCFSYIHVGDIVVFHHHGELLVKRVAAIGGMTVLLNGEEIIVPSGKLVVLGDNSENSFDSRYWEDPYIDECDVIAKVVEFQTKV